jgi:hypothetical protein
MYLLILIITIIINSKIIYKYPFSHTFAAEKQIFNLNFLASSGFILLGSHFLLGINSWQKWTSALGHYNSFDLGSPVILKSILYLSFSIY